MERPPEGDDSRTYPPFVEPAEGKPESGYYISLNRNKQSIAIDLKTQRGRQILKDLASKADVFVENFRPGVLRELGLDWKDLKDVNPRLIYASLSGFGQYGPYTNRAAYDMIVQAMSGIMSLTGHPSEIPVRVGVSIGDMIPGAFTAFSIASALYEREKSGLGQYIDVSMLDCLVACLENAVMRYFVSGKAPERAGTRHPVVSPADAFTANNGPFIVATGNEELWQKLCTVIGREDLIHDSRFVINKDRVKNHRELSLILNNVFENDTKERWVALLTDAGIPACPINSIEEVVADPQVIERDMIVEINQPRVGPVRVTGIAPKLSRTPGSIRSHAPAVGEHTSEVLSQILGYTQRQIRALMDEGVIYSESTSGTAQVRSCYG